MPRDGEISERRRRHQRAMTVRWVVYCLAYAAMVVIVTACVAVGFLLSFYIARKI
jgi:hypothetical protein